MLDPRFGRFHDDNLSLRRVVDYAGMCQVAGFTIYLRGQVAQASAFEGEADVLVAYLKPEFTGFDFEISCKGPRNEAVGFGDLRHHDFFFI